GEPMMNRSESRASSQLASGRKVRLPYRVLIHRHERERESIPFGRRCSLTGRFLLSATPFVSRAAFLMPRRPRLFSTPNHEPALSRAAPRASGVYYTAPEIVRQIVDLTLGPLVAREGPVRVLDPACGAGEFALEVLRRLRAAQGAETTRQAVFAMDIDAQ